MSGNYELRNQELTKFVEMYGHNIESLVKDYQRGNESKAVIVCCDTVVPDLNLKAYTRQQLIDEFKTYPSFPVVMKQFDTCNPLKQCVVGIVFQNDIMSHVLQIQIKKSK
jgi:hypothetical protein